MAAIDNLAAQVSDPALRKRIQAELRRASKQKKFGLVFEEHLPEWTPLYDVPLTPGRLAARQGNLQELYYIEEINGETAHCIQRTTRKAADIPVEELVTVAEFGDPIYPYLAPIDTVENAQDSDLWHTLIEADNYHALQLLGYLYAGKVDCIYIDPPYNTGAKDWKYNNDYVDGNDQYRHSKWLSFMEKRLKLAKKLLNPKDSVLIVTIDEKEYLHLGCLLEELFPDAHMQMVSIVNNPNGVARDHEMYRVEEYAYFIYLGQAGPVLLEDPLFTSDVNQRKEISGKADDINHSQRKIRWERLMRGGSDSDRPRSPGCFYPIYIDPEKHCVAKVGNAISNGMDRHLVPDIKGLVTVWPIAVGTGTEKRWRTTPDNFRKLLKLGYAKVGQYDQKNHRYSLLYLGKKQRERIERGQIKIIGHDENGVAIVEEAGNQIIRRFPKTIWNRQAHNAGEYGSRLIRRIIPGRDFTFPKSLYAVRDTVKTVMLEKPNALIVDFFAGSGTTLHAVNLLNAEDGGHRRCIMVTNNEVSEKEEKALKKQGYKPTDKEWQRLGIARYVTWPRTVCCIEGHDVNGQPLKGKYLGSDRPMADGFAANAAFFRLGFLDKHSVARGEQLEKLLPVLWMKAGAVGAPPKATEEHRFYLFPRNRFAVLINPKYTYEFTQALYDGGFDVAFIITDYEAEYRSIADGLNVKQTYQLYRDHLENFIINTGRN